MTSATGSEDPPLIIVDNEEASPSRASKQPLEYLTIKEVLEKFHKRDVLSKINVYGVVTYLPTMAKSFDKKDKFTQMTIVDQTCGLNDRLKLNIFSTPTETSVRDSCEIGDIIRFHRLMVQEFNGNPQGVHASKVSSWIRFKRVPTGSSQSEGEPEFDFVGNKSNNTVEDQDRKHMTHYEFEPLVKVRELREWLATNPQVMSLIEAGLSTDTSTNLSTNPSINPGENTHLTSVNVNSFVPLMTHFSPPRCRLTRFGEISREAFYDVVCQVCGVGDCKGTRFLLVWDGTKSSQSFFQENQFELKTENALYAADLLSYIYQVFVFDEFVLNLDSIRAGDFILLKNMGVRYVRINSQVDMVMKMPGNTPNGLKYGRAITKLAPPPDQSDSNTVSENEMENRVLEIWKKGKELNTSLVAEADFIREFSKLDNDQIDSTLNELIQKNSSKNQADRPNGPSPKKPSVLAQVNRLLDDDENAYNAQNQVAVTVAQTNEPLQQPRVLTNEFDNNICRLKRLVKLTYFVPLMTSARFKEVAKSSSKFEPYFSSLSDLADEAAKHPYMKCKVTAKMFNYSISSCPAIGSVFVACKQCGYLNFVPFHLANIYQTASLSMILKQQADINEAATQLANEREGYEKSFSLEWLKTAMPIDLVQLLPSQCQTNEPIHTYEYACPRCEKNSDDEPRPLSYIYRFWFVLRDQQSQLDHCLLEGDLAKSVLGSVEPLKFFTSSLKAHNVYKTIHRTFNRKFLFTIETFRLNQVDENNRIEGRTLDVFYRIADMVEIAPMEEVK